MPTNKEIGSRIRNLRETMNVSREKLSEAIGKSVSTVTMYEIGQRSPRDETKQKIATFFGVSVSSIFFND